ncbi:MAG: ABC transporter ATP-binding protein [Caldilineaceae bacterium]
MNTEFAQLQHLTWPATRLGEAVEVLAARRRLVTKPDGKIPALPALHQVDNSEISHWLEIAALHLGFEVEAVQATYGEIDLLVRGAHPALLRLPPAGKDEEPVFLLLLKTSWRRATVIGPDHQLHHITPQVLQAALCAPQHEPYMTQMAGLLAAAGVAAPRPQALQALAQELVTREGSMTTSTSYGWLLRPLPHAPLRALARYERLLPQLLTILGFLFGWQLLLALSWLFIGRGALQGYFDWGWFQAWMLAMITASIFQLFAFDYQGRFSSSVGRVFKATFLYGAMQLDVDELRHQGAGQYLARVMQAGKLETTLLARGINAAIYFFMLTMAGLFLGFGAGGWLHAALLVGWTLLLVVVGWRYLRLGATWVDTYRDLTNALVEQMVGHRTRLIQENPEEWHTAEDQALHKYLQLTARLNRIETLVESFLPQGWLIIGLLGIIQPLMTATAAPARLALSVGGILFAFQAYTALTRKFSNLLGASLAWDQVQPLLQAASRSIDAQDFRLTDEDEQPLIKAANLTFRYPSRATPVLQGCSLQIHKGERLLLEGPSGGGKSTLAALLSGFYVPDAGMLLLMGLDQRTLGAQSWRQRVVSVPQFQENHVITESLAFNLLMGRRWPPTPADLAEAETICRELGLGDLLDEMPEGLHQLIGDSGWQMSHGERSRLFIARALLQKPDLMILDESFGALDPENLQIAMHCVLKRASTVLVIAHP